ncbi:S-methyl-5-thioribose kinase [Fictibacillus nanhaiensis]|uniref:S-methyl-5-thioribose kinase n=1 Tax=Fictibacillus nanhaiensis TaxID=742169 RepID=UPI001C986B43|nr:S-methyl-5-thioribose kinase [Fictibacillus nanhaiensis]MBY6037126.1 S-methyl-5-thioribose kinase [Fictibacillus nanhaiensis]
MTRFSAYFLMNPADVIDYVKEKLTFFKSDAELSCEEIGDGNLNYVFRVVDEKHGDSLIIKQAGHTARISDEFKLSTDRIRIESNVLQLEDKLSPGLVPMVYLFDDVMSCCAMEDLSDYTIMRTALLNHETFPRFADDITTFMVNNLLLTSDVVMEHKEKKRLVQQYINTELCEITEDLVYTEPFYDHNNRNELTSGNEEWIKSTIYGDHELKLETAKLKFSFMNHAQSLLHGDLHTGSIFIKKESTKVIDPEFAFYGPMSYDIGNVVANLFFAWANGHAHGNQDFTDWIENTIEDVIGLFQEKFLYKWEQEVTELTAKQAGFKEWYLKEVVADTSAVTGLELIRRIVGLAKVKDITSIADSEKRIEAERICLTAAISFIKQRSQLLTGQDFVAVIKEADNMIKSRKVM